MKQAYGISVHACRVGCPVILFTDENDMAFASVHLSADAVEMIVKLLREVVAESEALRRPVV